MDLRPIFLEKDSRVLVDCTLDFSGEEFSGRYPLQAPVTVKGVVENRAGVVSFKADITVCYSAPCDRCAADAQRTHVIKLDRVLVNELAGEADDDKLLLKDMQLDLYETCFEETVLNLPLKHLCDDSCKGLCPTCGKNLNEGPCGCNME